MASADSGVVIVGAGVIGLAVGAALARRGTGVVIVERNGQPGQETSSRNSEVIHAGIYYPKDSHKARDCVDGRERLYARAVAENIHHRRVGKLIVATHNDELETLERIARRARDNGAPIEPVSAAEMARREPRVRAVAGLWSPSTGIVDAHELMASYQAELERHGGTVVVREKVVALEPRSHGWSVETQNPDGGCFTLDCEAVVNAAGLASDHVASLAGLDIDALDCRLKPCKGCYFALAPGLGAVTNHLVYPVPVAGGLGTHVTMDLHGRYRLGPDTEYVETLDYAVDPARRDAFAEAAARYLPEITAADLSPDIAGIRPKLQGPGEPFRDFYIAEESAHGAPGLVNLIGIESPGLTAAGAIAERVADLLCGRAAGSV